MFTRRSPERRPLLRKSWRIASGAIASTRGASALRELLKDDLEELNALPFSGVVRVERRALHPVAVTGRRPWIEHLEWVTAGAKSSRNDSLDRGPL